MSLECSGKQSYFYAKTAIWDEKKEKHFGQSTYILCTVKSCQHAFKHRTFLQFGIFFFLGCSQDFTAMYVLFYFILLSDKLSAVHMFTYQAKCSPHVYISIFHEISSAQAIKPNNCQHN